ncbi:MAG: hypothetical protein H6751_17895, partial [Candidatus Omnitrophica bacterium]|nr:hypothetical protein [Candidatus Omnitrophota bacterium]
KEECFRDQVPVTKDYFSCSHDPRRRFCIYVIDRYGNREVLHLDPNISSVCPTLFHHEDPQPLIADQMESASDQGEFFLTDVYEGIDHAVERGTVKYLRVVEEVKDELEQLSNGAYRNDHEPFMNFYVSPVDLVSGPAGWPTYVAKAPLGIVPVEEDGSAHFYAPAGKVLYFEILDENFNEIQRMRSVVQLQPGEKRSCIGCHEHRQMAPPNLRKPLASGPRELDTPSWGGKPFSYQEIVQPVLEKHCVSCHNAKTKETLNLSGQQDEQGIPASYRTLVSQGWVHYCDCGWNSGGCEKLEPLTFGTVKSKVGDVLNAGHYEVKLTTDEVRRFKTWIDMNCPLWPDYVDRTLRKHLGTRVSSLE